MLAPFTKKMVVRVSMKDKFYDSEVYMFDEDEDGTYWLLTVDRDGKFRWVLMDHCTVIAP
ncbi:MAG: hypothetical protein II875_02685 [Clostridia bacterium]|nr:hypothetical protein [Clostridia bacterium]